MMSSPAESSAFLPDEVELRVDDETRRISLAEFLELPLSERIGHVLSRNVSFFAAGRVLDRDAALAAIRNRHSR